MVSLLGWPVAWANPEEDLLDLEQVEVDNEDFLEQVKKLRPEKFGDLARLSPFSDVSVIQRRFMPKTGRVSASVGSNFVLSSEYFFHPGVEAHLAVHFLEKHGVELGGSYVFDFERPVTKDLSSVYVFVDDEVYRLRSFVGLTYKWMPVYGKMAFFNTRIVSFDIFFSLGGGMSYVSKGAAQKRRVVWEPTTMLGMGQVFAFTRDFGFRWDLKWHFTINTKEGFTFLNHFLMSVGLIWYFPSAGLR